MEQKLKNAMEKVELPAEMRQRLLQRCEKERINLKKRFYKRPLALVAALAVCVVLIGASIVASTGFRDVKDWRGAIIGQTYDAGANEITLSATYEEDGIRLTVNLLKGEERPYALLDVLKLAQYELIDSKGKAQQVAVSLNDSIVAGGGSPSRTELLIPHPLTEGTYRLVVREFIGIAKAEQDLPIRGHWECTFSVE